MPHTILFKLWMPFFLYDIFKPIKVIYNSLVFSMAVAEQSQNTVSVIIIEVQHTHFNKRDQ